MICGLGAVLDTEERIMKKAIDISLHLDKVNSLSEFRSLWLIDSNAEVCFQFDIHSDFGGDWDDDDEPNI